MTLQEKVKVFEVLCKHFNSEMETLKAMQDLIDSEYKGLMRRTQEYDTMTDFEQMSLETKVEMFIDLCEYFKEEMYKLKAMQDLIDSEYEELMEMVQEGE